MTITFINCDGGGYASLLDIAEGTQIDQLFEKQLPGRRPEDYLIRVDRLPATRDQVLTPGCRVSITPTKIAGAIVRAFAA
jgi:hypothetical protein